jgi:hypothetical protein
MPGASDTCRGDNVFEVPAECVRDTEFDCALYQHHSHYAQDRLTLLSDAQRALPTLFVEHDRRASIRPTRCIRCRTRTSCWCT